MLTKACDFRFDGVETKEMASGNVGIFKGYGSTFGNRDRDDDIIDSGAFGAVEPKAVKLLWQHQMSEPIGIWKTVKEDHHGLYVEGELNLETQRGREAYSLMKQGALGDMSIGFRVPRGGTYDKEISVDGHKRRVRHIKQVKLYEISLVTIPANPLARVNSVKSAGGSLMHVDDFREHAMRALGLNSREIDVLISKGYAALVAGSANDDDDPGDEKKTDKEALDVKTLSESLDMVLARLTG